MSSRLTGKMTFARTNQHERGILMGSLWTLTSLLGIESCEVIQLRVARLSHGGQGAWDELQLMVSEKIVASLETGAHLAGGGSFLCVLEQYRDRVAKNAGRLAG